MSANTVEERSVHLGRRIHLLLGDGKGGLHAPVLVIVEESSVPEDCSRSAMSTETATSTLLRAIEGARRKFFLGMVTELFENKLNSTMARADGGESQLLLADLHGTGKLDLAVGYFRFEGFSVRNSVFSGMAMALSHPALRIRPGYLPVWLDAADMNGDGKLDLVVASGFSNSVSVLLNQGSGNFILRRLLTLQII